MRNLLPLIGSTGSHPGGRSAMTCRYRCGDACFHPAPNTSANEYVGDVIAGALSRRSMMRAAAAVTVTAAAGGAVVGAGATPAAAQAPEGTPAAFTGGKAARGLRFTPVAPNTADAVTVPDGYGQNVVIRWGEPILRGAPAFDPDKQTAEAQAGQFGYNNDFLALLPLPGERGRQLLVANHEYTDEILMFQGYDAANPTREQVEIAWAAHGLSRRRGRGGPEERQAHRRAPAPPQPPHHRHHRVQGDRPGRRLQPPQDLRRPDRHEGPRHAEQLRRRRDPLGHDAARRGELQPVLRQREPAPTRRQRYGIGTGATERKWERFDERFDVAQEPNEAHRFGWVVELDPYDPDSTPRKRTALGRFKHEGATIRLADDGRAGRLHG